MSKRKRKGVKPELLSGVVTGHDDAELERQADALLKSQKAKGVYTEGELRLRALRVKGLVVKGYDTLPELPASVSVKLTARQRKVIRLWRKLGDDKLVAQELSITAWDVRKTLERAANRLEAALSTNQLAGLSSVLMENFGSIITIDYQGGELRYYRKSNWPQWLLWLAGERYSGRI